MTFKVCIPARYASSRLPGKPLLEIGGRPMLQWVIDAAVRSGAEEVVVATDDERIAAIAHDSQGRPCGQLTRADHLSGSDRIAEVAQARGWSDDCIVVNVQGDEPQLPPAVIGQVASLLRASGAPMATLSTPIMRLDEFLDPNVVKVVRDEAGFALYFSRAPIPWSRDTAAAGLTSQTHFAGAQRHLGIYAYRVGALKKMTALAPTALELTEKLEQLRALESGMRIAIATACEIPGPGVDTPHDLERVRAAFGKKAY